MEENTQEKNLIKKNENNSFFGKIKNFFKKFFGKNSEVEQVEETPAVENDESKTFKENLKLTEDEETKLLDLQKRYRKGEISEKDLTDEQIDALCDLYDKQIVEIENKIRAKQEELERQDK